MSFRNNTSRSSYHSSHSYSSHPSSSSSHSSRPSSSSSSSSSTSSSHSSTSHSSRPAFPPLFPPLPPPSALLLPHEKPTLRIDRKRHAPMLVRVFIKDQQDEMNNLLHTSGDFLHGQVPARELQLYLWKDVTFGEVADQLKFHLQLQRVNIDIGFVYPRQNGEFAVNTVGQIAIGRRFPDMDRQLQQKGFETGDYLSIRIQPFTTRTPYQRGTATTTSTTSTSNGADIPLDSSMSISTHSTTTEPTQAESTSTDDATSTATVTANMDDSHHDRHHSDDEDAMDQ